MSVQFHVGQRVVCIDAKVRFHPDEIYIFNGMEIEEGRIYTIRDIGFDEFHPEEVVVRLVEIYREPGGDETEESGFAVDRFRPVIERKTDISIFTNILNTQRVRTDA